MSLFIDFFAGCAGGAAGILIGHPFDTIKVRMQINQINVKTALKCGQPKVSHARNSRY